MLRALPLIVVAGYHLMKPPTCSSPLRMSEQPRDRLHLVGDRPELSGRGASDPNRAWTHTGHGAAPLGPRSTELRRGRVADRVSRDYHRQGGARPLHLHRGRRSPHGTCNAPHRPRGPPSACSTRCASSAAPPCRTIEVTLRLVRHRRLGARPPLRVSCPSLPSSTLRPPPPSVAPSPSRPHDPASPPLPSTRCAFAGGRVRATPPTASTRSGRARPLPPRRHLGVRLGCEGDGEGARGWRTS